MHTHQIVGGIFILIGLLDPVIAMLLIMPRIKKKEQRRILKIVITAGSIAFVGIGAAMAGGAFR